MWITEITPETEEEPVPVPVFLQWREHNHVFEQISAYVGESFNLTVGDNPERIRGAKVTYSFFPTLEVQPALGRNFTAEEDQPGGRRAVIVSYGLWQRQLGGNPNIVGQTLDLNNEIYTVIGVMPPYFHLPQEAEIWLPIALDVDSERKGELVSMLSIIARLRSGITIQQAESELNIIARQLESANLQHPTGRQVKLTSLHEHFVSNARPALLVLLGAVNFVLLIACTNVAGLLLVRAVARQKEIAIRAALGASRFRLVRQTLTESLLLAMLSGTLGLALAFWGIRFFNNMISVGKFSNVPHFPEIGIDVQVLAFTLIVSSLIGILSGLAPAFLFSMLDLNESLKEGPRIATVRLPGRTVYSLLLIAEVALSIVLLIGAGLLIKSFLRLWEIKPGFSPQNVLTLRISLPQPRYTSPRQWVIFYEQVLQRIESLPGVKATGAINHLPLTDFAFFGRLRIEDRPRSAVKVDPAVPIGVVSPDYFQAMGIPLRLGRTFTERDTEGSPRVVIINEALAQRFFPDEDPIGKRVKGPTSPDWLSIVGIVGDVRHLGLDKELTPEIYLPLLQNPSGFMTLVVHTTSDPMELATVLRKQVLAIDKEQPVYDVRTMVQRLSDSVAQRRFNTVLFALFATVALMLTVVGAYGVMAYSVTQRTHEIAVRLALGARRSHIIKLVVGQGLALTIIGVGIGLAGAYALTRTMSSLLFGVTATDPITFAFVSLLLLGVVGIASYIPARKIVTVDPMLSLRHE